MKQVQMDRLEFETSGRSENSDRSRIVGSWNKIVRGSLKGKETAVKPCSIEIFG